MSPDAKKGSHSDINVRKKIYESIIRPRMLSGLNVFNINAADIKELVNLEKDVLRTMMNVRDKSPMNTLYKITGQLPHLHKGIFSLIHTIWSNSNNPVNTLLIRSTQDQYNKGTWLEEAERTLKTYNMPNLANLLKLKCPDKDNWKNFCKKEIKTKWELIIGKEREDLQWSVINGKSKIDLNNKIMETLKGANTWTDLQGIKCMMQIMGDSLENNHRLKKCGKRKSDLCTNCNETETMIHAIYCRNYKDDYGVKSKEAAYNNALKGLIEEADIESLNIDSTAKLAIRLHPFDHIKEEHKKRTKREKKDTILTAQRKFFAQILIRHEIHRKENNKDQDGETPTDRVNIPYEEATPNTPILPEAPERTGHLVT